MIRALASFVEELRAVGIPVSLVEAIDGAEALRHVDLADRRALRAALGATLVKNARHYPAFDAAFDVFFGLAAARSDAAEADRLAREGAVRDEGGGGSGDAATDLAEAVAAALAAGDRDGLRRLVRIAVERFGGIEPGRPVGGRYYFHRVMRQLDTEHLLGLLREAVATERQIEAASTFERRLADERVARLMEALRDVLRDEILQRLVADRGAEAVARTVRVPLVEDLDLMHATRDELAQIERAVIPLARKLATRLAARRRRGAKGRLDVRRTIRRSLAHGGALLEPQFRPPRRSKPELVLLCDVSGSMATFARFTMQLTSAISSQFANVRTFAFIDGIDEVTRFYGTDVDFHEGLLRMSSEADLVRHDGHSDYGRSFAELEARYLDAVTPRSVVLVTGDARNNYRETGADALTRVSARARGLFWLNPEARRYWDTGDSVMSFYAPACDVVDQVRTLRELEGFVERVALPGHRPLAVPAVPAAFNHW